MNTQITLRPVTEEITKELVEPQKTTLTLPDGTELTLGDIVKERTAWFSFYRQGYLYYNLLITDLTYSFPIPVADLQTATVSAEEKAITLMRYIRKAIASGQLVRVRA